MTDDRSPDSADGDPTGNGPPEDAAAGGGAPPPPPPPPSVPAAAAGAAGGAAAAGAASGGGGSKTPWIIAAVAAVVAAVAITWAVASAGDDDGDVVAGDTTTTEAVEDVTTTAGDTTTSAGETTTTVEETTTTVEETTTTVEETTTTVAGIGGECAIENLNLLQPGVLTVATGEPAFPPWVGDDDNFDDPTSKTGFEAALVYELAATLGFTDDQVEWVRTGFDEAVAPGPKDFDFNLQQYSITDVRDQVVDFSDPYYVTRQSLVALAGSPLIGATTLADVADARLGAQIGTTSLDYIEDVIQPNEQASVYDTNIDAISALIAGQIDGIVVDLPTAYFITAVQIPEQGAEGVIVAQFATPAQEPDEYGLLFADGNELVSCVNQGLTILRDDGVLDDLEAQWLTQGGDIPTITE